MRLSARRALSDVWMRVRMSLQLIGAIAPTARRHKELLLFPLLSLFTTVSLFLGILVLANALIVQAEDVPPMGLVALVVAFTSLFLYLRYVSKTFFDVALTFAAFRALRDEHTSLRAALVHALARVGPIVAYTGTAVAAGVLVAPLAMISRSRTVVTRLLPSLDIAWSVVPLMAIPVLVREPCGGLAAIRRAATLFRERWGEVSVAVVSLRALWLSIAAASLFVFQRWPSNPSESGSDMLWLGVILVLCVAPMLIDSLVSSLYGAALYVFAVEGVVPSAFDTAELRTVWRVGRVPAEGGPQPAGPASGLRPRRQFWWSPVAALAVTIVVVMSLGPWAPAASQPFPQLRHLVSGSRPGLLVNDQNFPDRLQMVWSHELGVPISGLAVRPGTQVIAGGPATIFVLDRAGNVVQQSANHSRGQDWASMVSGDLVVTADLPGIAGTSSIISGRWGHAIRAYDASGAERWTWRMTEGGNAVDDIAAIRVPGQADFVAVGRNGFGGLCLLDARGVEQWCNKSVGNVGFVTALNCDGDGREEILSKSPRSHPFFGSKLGCYSTEGQLVRDLNVPVEPFHLRTFDARGNGRQDLLAWYRDGLAGPLVLAAWTAEGDVLGELRLQTAVNVTGATIAAVNLRGTAGADMAVALADGWVVGTSLDRERWGHRIAGADGTPPALTALDLDGDGAQELIIASGQTVSAWTWTSRTARARP